MLAARGGHPLQSVLWGESRKRAEGGDYRCWVGRRGTVIAGLARTELRRIPAFGTVAWIPGGPVVEEGEDPLPGLWHTLAEAGFIMGACTPWRRRHAADDQSVPAPQTIWIDLTLGRERLLQELDPQWRYGARRALREGVEIVRTADRHDTAVFHQLCVAISRAKDFQLPASLALMQQLLDLSVSGAGVEARLFVARHEGRLAGGAFILRVGRHLHYLWGAVDRECARLRAGEALQWAVIEWGLAGGCTLYDLEGIDPLNNPGTYQFKKKMGGSEVTLAPPVRVPLDWRGRLVAQVLRCKQRLKGRGAA